LLHAFYEIVVVDVLVLGTVWPLRLFCLLVGILIEVQLKQILSQDQVETTHILVHEMLQEEFELLRVKARRVHECRDRVDVVLDGGEAEDDFAQQSTHRVKHTTLHILLSRCKIQVRHEIAHIQNTELTHVVLTASGLHTLLHNFLLQFSESQILAEGSTTAPSLNGLFLLLALASRSGSPLLILALMLA